MISIFGQSGRLLARNIYCALIDSNEPNWQSLNPMTFHFFSSFGAEHQNFFKDTEKNSVKNG